jgi:hypothetical protein
MILRGQSPSNKIPAESEMPAGLDYLFFFAANDCCKIPITNPTMAAIRITRIFDIVIVQKRK